MGGPYSKHWAIETHPVAAHRGATGLVIAPAIDSRFQLHHPTASPNAQNWSPPRSCQSTRAPSNTHQELIFGGVHPQLDRVPTRAASRALPVQAYLGAPPPRSSGQSDSCNGTGTPAPNHPRTAIRSASRAERHPSVGRPTGAQLTQRASGSLIVICTNVNEAFLLTFRSFFRNLSRILPIVEYSRLRLGRFNIEDRKSRCPHRKTL